MRIEWQENVYKPAEDTYLLLECVSHLRGKRILEVGCGCGIIAIYLAKHGNKVDAIDISNNAVKLTKKNAEANNVEIAVWKSDLFEKVNDKYDVIIFNPPYLPVENEDLAWSGGKEGTEVVERFLLEAGKHLREGGCIYLLVSSLQKDIEKKIIQAGWKFKRIKKISFPDETLSVFLLYQ